MAKAKAAPAAKTKTTVASSVAGAAEMPHTQEQLNKQNRRQKDSSPSGRSHKRSNADTTESDPADALSAALTKAVIADFKNHGAQAVAAAREANPSTYLKLVTSLLPKATQAKAEDGDDFAEAMLAILTGFDDPQ